MPTEDTNPHIVTQLKAGSFGYISPYLRYEQNITNRLAFSLSGDYTYAENDYPYELKGGAITRKDRRTNSRMNQGHAEINVLWKMLPRRLSKRLLRRGTLLFESLQAIFARKECLCTSAESGLQPERLVDEIACEV